MPWEHYIGCQMCQIALSKKTGKVNLKNKIIYSSDSSESSEKNHATSLKKISVPNLSYKTWVTKF